MPITTASYDTPACASLVREAASSKFCGRRVIAKPSVHGVGRQTNAMEPSRRRQTLPACTRPGSRRRLPASTDRWLCSETSNASKRPTPAREQPTSGASSRALPGARPHYADPLESVPTAYFPTGGLVDSLDARVDDPSARCAVRRGDDFPLAGFVGEAVANQKLHWEDLVVGR